MWKLVTCHRTDGARDEENLQPVRANATQAVGRTRDCLVGPLAVGSQGGWCQMSYLRDTSAHPICARVDTPGQNPFQT